MAKIRELGLILHIEIFVKIFPPYYKSLFKENGNTCHPNISQNWVFFMNKIKKLALGTAQFGLPYGISNKNGQVSQYDASQILIKAKSVGIGVLDTAIAYGDGERILGKCDLNDFKIITKLPDFKEDKKELGTWFERQLSTSFSRLDVKNIDGLLLHRPEQLFTEHGDYLYALLQEAKADGKINRIGLSLYDPSEIPKCFDKFEFDLIQIQEIFLIEGLKNQAGLRTY